MANQTGVMNPESKISKPHFLGSVVAAGSPCVDIPNNNVLSFEKSGAFPEGDNLVTISRALDVQPEVRKPEQADAIASMYGPFRLKLSDGRDITPSSSLRQAILAVLISTHDQTKPRRSIQDMFWGSADRDRASANLRSVLHQLRLDLAPIGKNVIGADRNVVTLAQGVIEIKTTTKDGAAFLEGMALPLKDCEGFEDWLREMRNGTGVTSFRDLVDVPIRSPSAISNKFTPTGGHGRPERHSLRNHPGSTKSEKAVAIASLYGPFRLRLLDGRDITPSSPLRQAILSVLILAPGQTKPRRSIQDMFWGSEDSSRASANLRSVLHQLRKDLNPIGKQVIRADRNVVSLAEGAIETETKTTGMATFMEGTDLPLRDCEGFEDWLREMRCDTRVSEFGQAAETRKHKASSPEYRLGLGFLPSLHSALIPEDEVRINAIINDIARFSARATMLCIHDMRGYDFHTLPLPIESGHGPTHLVQALAEYREKHLLVSFKLLDLASRRIIWISDTIDANSHSAEDTAVVVAETMMEQIARNCGPYDGPDLFPWTALTALFSLDSKEILRTETQVSSMLQSGGPIALEILRVFAQVFKENEGVDNAQLIDINDLREMVASVPDTDPLLPLWQSLAGYSAYMLLGETDFAELLLNDANERSPNLSINLDHLAVLKFSRGDLQGAEAILQRCQRVGTSSPWRYTYDVTGSMIAMAKGDYPKSLAFANKALLRKPRFVGALRYAMAGFALSNNPLDAKRMFTRIHQLRPGYDFRAWSEGMIRRSPPEMGAMLQQSFKINGFI